MIINEAKNCRVCGSDIKQVIDFGEIHINDFPLEQGNSPGSSPMILDQCASCKLVQLRHTVDPKALLVSKRYQR